MTVLPAWLADPALRPVWEAAAARLEKRSLQPGGRIVLDGLDRASRHAVGSLLGRAVVAPRVAVDLAELDALLRERSGVGGLRAVVEAALGRRLRDRAGERDAAARAREEPFVAARLWLDAHPSVASAAWPEEWLAAVRRSGLVARSPDAGGALVHALGVLAALTVPAPAVPTVAAPCAEMPAAAVPATAVPAAAEAATAFPLSSRGTSRAELAARFTGDAHGLDDGRLLGQLVIRGLAIVAGVDPPTGAAARRALWERFGVAVDSVSSTCLVLGLRPPASGGCASRLPLAADSGDPVHLTGWDIRRCAPAVAPGTPVLVCENPRVLEAFAERHGGRFTVVCVAGEPNVVTLDVLRALRACGASLRYHGDFDWPGIAIANRLGATVGIEPWLMSAADYRRAVGSGGPPLIGRPVPASWDNELGPAMAEHGVAVHEEAVVEELLDASVGSLGVSP